MPCLGGLSLVLWEAQDSLTGSFGRLSWRKEQANVFKELPLIGLHEKQIIPFGRTNRLAQTAREPSKASPVNTLPFQSMCFKRREASESIALRFLVFLLLFLFVLLRLAFVGLAFLVPLLFRSSKRLACFVVCLLNMPLSENDSRLMFY
jgi:hypothetical protein